MVHLSVKMQDCLQCFRQFVQIYQQTLMSVYPVSALYMLAHGFSWHLASNDYAK
jgi:hypothetical protein